MTRAWIAALALAALWPLETSAQQIEWKQVLNTPKGLNLPRDRKVDILGIAPGDTYDEAKTKLNALLAEDAKLAGPAAPKSGDAVTQMERAASGQMFGVARRGPLMESRRQFRIPVDNTSVTVSYIAVLNLQREYPGSGKDKIRGEIIVVVSAPSSGSQVLGVKRQIRYEQQDQPRVSELMRALGDKLGGPPQVYVPVYRFQFDNGRLVTPPGANINSCQTSYATEGENAARDINHTGQCDVVMDVLIGTGISADHARTVTFTLSATNAPSSIWVLISGTSEAT
ncbi:hypothetical protein GPL17_35990 [Bradyrhizobium yuanmingense]|uniref:hypothetical protein n=1 Tax=Bradyrhizobium yuanmingense TaxID=108015 RepID=UPI0012F7905F|nr:hypothetical protein [Bradyrhizobium yuanmingense]MVT55801.1 hypothetical protein [Bradyrhizobium yuanmingense]